MINFTEEQREDLVNSLINAISIGVFMFCLLLGAGTAVAILTALFTWLDKFAF